MIKSNSLLEITLDKNMMDEMMIDRWSDDPAVRESILREAAQEILWDSEETLPPELDDF